MQCFTVCWNIFFSILSFKWWGGVSIGFNRPLNWVFETKKNKNSNYTVLMSKLGLYHFVECHLKKKKKNQWFPSHTHKYKKKLSCCYINQWAYLSVSYTFNQVFPFCLPTWWIKVPYTEDKHYKFRKTNTQNPWKFSTEKNV